MHRTFFTSCYILVGCYLLGLLLAPSMTPQAAGATAIGPKYQVKLERNVMIPMRDGKRLCADLIRPDTDGRFPVILEYHPYRKDDLSRSGLNVHYYFAERGFVGVRLDVRGTGGSEGINTDEYHPQEQEDGYDAVEWLARQPWSNGNVGMFGTSYGGFTAIQVAMHRPSHLKAVVPMYATDDRYTDDCHYTPGGNMRMYYDVGTYGGSMVARNALPPIPEFTGSQWMEIWQQRLEQNEPYLLHWMKHQVDGTYWRRASLRPDYGRIECPVFLIGGWQDGYANSMLRIYTRLAGPKKILMGPWVHTRPDTSVPGPRIDYLNEVTRFFSHWLKGEDTGIMKEPPVTIYLQEYTTPQRTLQNIPGEWRSDTDFPVPGTHDLTLYLEEGGGLETRSGGEPRQAFDAYEYIPTVGLANRYWSAGGISFYLADDQRADEAYSLTFTSPPFEQQIQIAGWPRLILFASSSAPVATFVAKLSDVAPDGHSMLIVEGSLNGTRRKSLTEPAPMAPGEIYELQIPMAPTGWTLKPGHRLRLALSGADFPNLWPSPEKAHNQVYRGGQYPSRLILPLIPESKLSPPHYLPPPSLREVLKSYATPPTQQVIHDQITGTVTVTNRAAQTLVLEEGLGSISSEASFRCSTSSRDPSVSSIVGVHQYVLKREDGTIEVTAESTVRATRTAFHILINLQVNRNGLPFFHRKWMVSEPRSLL